MKTTRLLLALLAFAPAALFAHHDTPAAHADPAKESPKADAAKRYPLKGVIVDVLPDQTALLVKHEEIPGFMGAMTMLFKVDAATFKAAAKGRAITALLVQKEDGFWLEDVKPVKP